jgi:biopolymer transport protein ExbD
MAIYAPGKRDRHNRSRGRGSRSVVAMLSLTAMVDMFTVLVVFLLQNYKATGETIQLPKQVPLPEARVTKELKPAFVVTISESEVSLDKDIVATVDSVKAQQDWIVEPLKLKLQQAIEAKIAEAQSGLGATVKKAIEPAPVAKEGAKPEEKEDPLFELRKVTIQAEKKMDFLTVKKIMMTVTEAGATQINFAVVKREGT